MEFTKSYWENAGGDTMRMQMPITKYDAERRLVFGFATLDNVDQHDDQVTKESSAKAFANFRGNIREMHQPIAAGRLADFREEKFYDAKTGQEYTGVYVSAYISKGAQDTWEKVLDGTLSGFSIGGSIVDSYTEFNKSANKNVRIIKDYALTELSLVDSPANQLSNIVSFAKGNDGMFIKGILADTTIVNVFWCGTDEIAKQSSNASEVCLHCDNQMEQIGWFEKGVDEEKSVRETITKFLQKSETGTGEGGVSMGEENNTETQEEVKAEETPAPEAAEEAKAEETPNEEVAAEQTASPEAETPNEEPSVEPDFQKMFGDLHDAVTKQLEKSQEDISKAVEGVETKVEEVKQSFAETTAELKKSFDELNDKYDSVKREREGVEKRLDALEGATAIKKSQEVEDTSSENNNTVTKGMWGGSILGDF